jgi:hypothetical protein
VAKELRDGHGLESAARRLAETLHDPATEPAAQASIARELRMILHELATRPVEKGSPVDEFAEARRRRRAGTG